MPIHCGRSGATHALPALDGARCTSYMEVPWNFHGVGNGSFVEACKKGAFLFTPFVCVHTLRIW